MTYEEFLKRKQIKFQSTGIENPGELNPMLFDFQKDIDRWALKKGKAAIFADCGLGKTPMQLEYGNKINKAINAPVLILAPLAVSSQTIREGQKFGVEVKQVEMQADVINGLNITNYEKLEHFNLNKFGAVILDESSILKAYDGKTRTAIIEKCRNIPYKLACTATPAPNDYMELGNHAEFLGVMTRTEMLSTFFIHDGGDTSKWRLKGHAEDKFWEWVASWAVVIRKPSDLGYEDGKFKLPKLNIIEEVVKSPTPTSTLIPIIAQTLMERRQARAESIQQRVERCAEIVRQLGEQFLVWCNLNAESEMLTKAIPGAVEVKGSDSDKHKIESAIGFANGDIKVLVSKPSIFGYGMNFQKCHNMAFVGLSDSYEQFYQALRRCWRFGQEHEVNAYIITSDREGAVIENIKRKEADAERMADAMVQYTKEITKKEIHSTTRETTDYKTAVESGDGWTLYLGDCVELIKKLKNESIHYSIFSPPFSSLYTYSNSDRDMGNCRTDEEFMEHFKFLVTELYRVIMPGRLVSIHCMDLPMMKQKDGVIGLKDFPAEIRQLFENAGFIYHSKVTIWKDPVVEMQRTKALGLLHKQIKKDSAMCRQGLPDYLITMRKPGDNPEKIEHTNDTFPVDVWQRYASPVWFDINQSNTLNREPARDGKDEKHICPLQLDVIDRALKLWTNPGDIVLSPFAGIGSEGYESLKLNRKFIGIELKESYWNQGVANLRAMEHQKKQGTLFDLIKMEG